MGGHEEQRGPLGRSDYRSPLSEGVRIMPVVGTSGHRWNVLHRGGDGPRPQGGDGRGSSRNHRISGIAGLIVIALALAACSDKATPAAATQRGTPNISFAAIESPSMAFLPRQEEIQGWRLVDDPLVYPADKLTTYLASDAQHFRKYDVIDLTVGEYHRVDGGGVAMVEIFRFPDFVKAFGAFST